MRVAPSFLPSLAFLPTGIISVILRHTFLPHNNTRLTHLCGPADAHLRTI